MLLFSMQTLTSLYHHSEKNILFKVQTVIVNYKKNFTSDDKENF